MTIFYADGSGWSGTKSMWAVVWDKNEKIKKYNNPHTNNEMEYEAVIYALEQATDNDTIFTDSLLIVEQLAGSYVVKAENLKPLFAKAKSLILHRGATVVWISRQHNIAGLVLEKLNGEEKC